MSMKQGIDKDATICNVCNAQSTSICTYTYLCTSSEGVKKGGLRNMAHSVKST